MPEFRKCFCSSGRNASFWFDKFDYFSGKEKTFNCHYVFKKTIILLFLHILLPQYYFQSSNYFFSFLDVDERIWLSVGRTVDFCNGHRVKPGATFELVRQRSDRRRSHRRTVATVMLTVDCDAFGALANATLRSDAGDGDDTFRSRDATSTRSRHGRRNPGQRVQVNGRNFISLNQFF